MMTPGWRPSLEWLVRATIATEPIEFTVDHSQVDTSAGGRQSVLSNFGPYSGMLVAPGVKGRIPQPILSTTPAGEEVDEQSWTLLAPAEARVSHDPDALDFVQSDAGRFRVTVVRRVGAFNQADPYPDGWLVGLEKVA